jgi:HNH endonuclease
MVFKLFGYSADTEEFDDRYLRKPGSRRKSSGSRKLPKINTKQCCYCWASFKDAVKTRDHIHPKSKGGKLTRPCCYACNQEKADMTLEEYISFLSEMMDVFEAGSPNWKKYRRKLSNAKKLHRELTTIK